MQPFRARDGFKSLGKRIFKSRMFAQLKATSRETSRLVPKQNINFYIPPLTPPPPQILLIDGREKTTETHRSPPSSGYGTPTDMKAPSEEDMRGMAQDEGKSFIQEQHRQQSKCKVAFQEPTEWVSPHDPHPNTHPPAAFCLLVTFLFSSAELTVM